MRPLTVALSSALLVSLPGCRDFSLPPEVEPALFPLGIDCAADEECQSGACVDATCCEKVCPADEACNLGQRRGRCTPRPPGAPCVGGPDCPGGLCLHTKDALGDRVSFCCEKPCALSERCDLPGHEGRCLPRPPGDACQAGGHCPSGLCLPGVDSQGRPFSFCCERACDDDERCDLPGRQGSCAPRPLGDACSLDDQCPTGSCVDGVCCDGPCDGTCQTCLGPTRGTCATAADNTDPRGECGLCGACVEGACGAAEAGTDPAGGCGAGFTCSPGQRCKLPAGAPCASSEECAVGVCALGQCLSVSAEAVFAEPMSPTPKETWVNAVAAAGPGELALSVGEVLGQGSGVSAQAVHVLRRRSGSWSVAGSTEVPDLYRGPYAADLTFWNHRLFESVSLGQCSGASCGEKGLRGRLYSSSGYPGETEVIGPNNRKSLTTTLLLDPQRRLLDFVYDGAGTRLYRRESAAGQPPAWDEVDGAPQPASAVWAAAMFGDRPVLAEYSSTALALRDLVTGELLDQGVPTTAADCDLDWMAVGAFGAGADAGLVITGGCWMGALLATWRPAAPEGERFHFETTAVRGPKPVPGTALPVVAALTPASKAYYGYDAAVLWLEGGAWKRLTAFVSTGLVASRVSAVADDAGMPVLAIDLAQVVESGSLISYQNQAVRAVWLHP